MISERVSAAPSNQRHPQSERAWRGGRQTRERLRSCARIRNSPLPAASRCFWIVRAPGGTSERPAERGFRRCDLLAVLRRRTHSSWETRSPSRGVPPNSRDLRHQDIDISRPVHDRETRRPIGLNKAFVEARRMLRLCSFAREGRNTPGPRPMTPVKPYTQVNTGYFCLGRLVR